MPDFWKPFRRSHQPSNSSEDTLVESLQHVRISEPETSYSVASQKASRRVDQSKAALSVAGLTVNPQVGRSRSEQPWPGGFTSTPPYQVVDHNGAPLQPGRDSQVYSAPAMAMPTPQTHQAPEHLPIVPSIPVEMPIPASIHDRDRLSLTMQHAVLGDIDLGPNPNRSSSQQVSALLTPTVPPRPHSDSSVPSYNHEITISAPPSAPKRRNPNLLAQPPQSVPAPKLTKANLSALDTGGLPSKRGRASSAPPTPSSASVPGSSSSGAQQCNGVTQKGVRCTKKVLKNRSELGRLDPDVGADIERYCHLHRSDVLEQPMTYVNGKRLIFADFIPPYLQEGTVASLRTTMTQGPSDADTDGYIYTFEIIDARDTNHVRLKVGRAVKLNKRIDQWDKKCKSKQQVLRGWWPGPHDGKTSLLKGTVDPGLPGLLNHKLERLVHLELADLALNAPYLERGWPNLAKAPPLNQKPIVRTACSSCGTVHQEIFTFPIMVGSNQGKEYELLVRPVVAKWGRYLKEFWGNPIEDGQF